MHTQRIEPPFTAESTCIEYLLSAMEKVDGNEDEAESYVRAEAVEPHLR